MRLIHTILFTFANFAIYWTVTLPTWNFSWGQPKAVSVLVFRLTTVYNHVSGFPRFLESPGILLENFQDLESPGKWPRSWKVLEIARKWCGGQFLASNRHVQKSPGVFCSQETGNPAWCKPSIIIGDVCLNNVCWIQCKFHYHCCNFNRLFNVHHTTNSCWQFS